MPATVHQPQLLEETSLEVTREGVRMLRGKYIKDIPVDRDNDPAIAWKAWLASGCAIGQGDESVPGCTLERALVTPKSNDQAVISLSYETPRQTGGGGGQINKFTLKYGTSLVSTETQLDFNKNPLQTKWGTSSNPKFIINTATVPVLKPRATIEATALWKDAPHPNWFLFTGYTNSRPWQSGEPRTWLYMGLDATTTDEGKNYNVSMGFLYNPDTWDAFVIHRNPDGTIPKKAADAAKALYGRQPPYRDDRFGVGRYAVYGSVDFDVVFSQLNVR